MILGHSEQYFKLFKFYILKKNLEPSKTSSVDIWHQNLVSHLVLIFEIRAWWATWCLYLKSEPGEPPGVNKWNNCPQTSKQATTRHTEKISRPDLTVRLKKYWKSREIWSEKKWEPCPWHENAMDLFCTIHYLYFVSAYLPEFCAKPRRFWTVGNIQSREFSVFLWLCHIGRLRFQLWESCNRCQSRVEITMGLDAVWTLLHNHPNLESERTINKCNWSVWWMKMTEGKVYLRPMTDYSTTILRRTKFISVTVSSLCTFSVNCSSQNSVKKSNSSFNSQKSW